MRYGRPNAGIGPGGGPEVEALCSGSNGGRGDAIVAALVDGEGALVSGGGSIEEKDVADFVGSAGSGRDGISSSVRVSIVISFVSMFDIRRL